MNGARRAEMHDGVEENSIVALVNSRSRPAPSLFGPASRRRRAIPLDAMDGALRCLRDAVAPDEGAACLVVVADDPRADGDEGIECFAHLAREHAAAASSGRAHARRTVLVACERDPASYRLPPATRVVNLNADPYGWLAAARDDRDAAPDAASDRPTLANVPALAAALADALGPAPTRVDSEPSRDAPPRDAPEPTRGKRSGLWGVTPKSSARVLVAVDGVASLVAASRDEPVLRLVDALRADPRVAAVLLFHRGAAAPVGTPGNQDGTPRDDNGTLAASALRRAASCYVDVASVPASTTNRASSAENPTTPDATLTSTFRRPTGRSRIEHENVYASFEPEANGERRLRVSFGPSVGGVDASSSATTAEAEAELARRKSQAGAEAEAEAELARLKLQAAVPFNLSVSAAESEARARVVLPFEHQGAGRRAYRDGNFTSYLPADAGGDESAGKGRGHIMYVRDSDEDSPPDSDEEVDDDAFEL